MPCASVVWQAGVSSGARFRTLPFRPSFLSRVVHPIDWRRCFENIEYSLYLNANQTFFSCVAFAIKVPFDTLGHFRQSNCRTLLPFLYRFFGVCTSPYTGLRIAMTFCNRKVELTFRSLTHSARAEDQGVQILFPSSDQLVPCTVSPGTRRVL